MNCHPEPVLGEGSAAKDRCCRSHRGLSAKLGENHERATNSQTFPEVLRPKSGAQDDKHAAAVTNILLQNINKLCECLTYVISPRFSFSFCPAISRRRTQPCRSTPSMSYVAM